VLPLLEQTDAIGVEQGEVLELQVDESATVELALQGGAARVCWNPMRKVDGWRDGVDVTARESRLFVLGLQPGVATLKVTRGGATREVPITVKAKR
jgi:hypothetical protein